MAGRHNLQEHLQQSEMVSPIKMFYYPDSSGVWGFGRVYANVAATDTDSGYHEGCIWTDSSSNAVKVNTNTIASATWTDIDTSASVSLDGAFDNGKVINGAVTEAAAMSVGGATDYFSFWQEGANDIRIGTSTGANITIIPEGGTVSVTGIIAASGNVTVGGDLTVTGSLSLATLAIDAVVASTASTALSLDGNGTGGVKLGETSSGAVAIYQNATLAASKTLTLAGVGASNIFVITAGDAVMSDGSLTITDADNATTLSVINNTMTTTGALCSLASSSLTTGDGLSVIANAVTSGTLCYLETSAATFVGKYIQCYDGTADDFSVGLYGATIIAGNAAATDALTLTAGDITLTAGYVQLSNGVVQADTVGDLSNYFKRNQATTTGPLLELEVTNTSDDHPALLIDANQTAGVNAVEIAYDGTAAGISSVAGAAAGTAASLSGAASATDSVVKVIHAGTGATGFLGATGVGMVNITSDGNLAHANASMLLITYSGTGAATGLGTCLRIVDTGATDTSYAAYISAATGKALNVANGTSIFAEQIELGGGFKTTTGGFIVSDSGAASMDIDGGAAQDILNIGSTTATDVLFHGSGAAGEDMNWDSSASALEFTTGSALVLPQGTGSGGSGRQDVEGSIFWETDAGKLWVYKGAGWVGTVLT